MKWIVGVDLREGCEGALAWAQWLRQRDADVELLAAHAVEVPKGLIPPNLDTVMEHVTRFVGQRLPAAEVRLFDEHPADAALGHAVGTHGVSALAIGRRAPRDGNNIVRLGAVARRLLRQLPAPVVVCPADLDKDQIPDGPILVCVQPNVESASALAFGRQLAKTTGMPLHAVSVLPPAFPPGITYLPAPSFGPEQHQEREDAVRAWLAEQPGEPVELSVGDGPVVPKILEAADEFGASAIVCGSRLLSRVERIMTTSVGTALAGSARVPVAVVPPTP